MRSLVTASALVAATMLSLATTARRAEASEGRTSSLSWVRLPGAESCIPTQSLARAVEERLARRVFVSAAQADVSVEGRIEKKEKPSGWHAVITVRDAKGALLGTRELDRADASCESMNEPLALVIAVMIDPDAALKPAPAPAPAPAPLPPPASEPPAPTPPVAPPPSPAPDTAEPTTKHVKEPWRAEGAALFAMSAGLAPKLVPGVSVEGILFIPNVSLGIRAYGSLFLPVTEERDGARASFDLVYAGSALCPTLRTKSVVGMICLGGQLGVLRSHAETPGRAIEDKTSVIWNAVTELRVSIPVLAPVEVTAAVGAVLPLLRPSVAYASSGAPAAGATENLHKVSVFGMTGALGVGFFFP
ncbi:MAG: hypothetical protein JST00_34835 [Deltaproteobacteria bacterium]|nr:hypothetical protein [Deltaproteobacteria bacterium]